MAFFQPPLRESVLPGDWNVGLTFNSCAKFTTTNECALWNTRGRYPYVDDRVPYEAHVRKVPRRPTTVVSFFFSTAAAGNVGHPHTYARVVWLTTFFFVHVERLPNWRRKSRMNAEADHSPFRFPRARWSPITRLLNIVPSVCTQLSWARQL